MIVVYCDICGKRIEYKYDKRFRFTAYERIGLSIEPNTAKQIINSDDICETCINRINNYIAELKREG